MSAPYSDPPRIHDLDELRDLIPDGWAVREAFPDLAALSFWAVHGRYPGEWLDISTDEAASLVEMKRDGYDYYVRPPQ